MNRFMTAVTVLLFLVLSCSQSPTAGRGSGTETTNSFVYLASGAPAVNCTVRVIESSTWIQHASMSSTDFVIDSAVTKEDGSFSIEYEPSAENNILNLQLDHDSAGLLRGDLSYRRMDSAVYTLEKYATVEGRVEETRGNAMVVVEGTAYSAPVGNDGTFTLHKVPAGSYALFVNRNGNLYSGSSVNTAPDSQIQITLPYYGQDEFLFADFESGYSVPGMETAGIPVFWYLFSDSTSKAYKYETDTWTLLNPQDFEKSGNSSVTSSIVTSEGSNTLHMDAFLDQNVAASYAGLGIVFYTDDNGGIDLSSLDSIQCSIQGQGTLKINFLCRHPEHDSEIRFINYYSLTQAAANTFFDVGSFEPDPLTPDSLATSWSEARSQVRMLEFAFFRSDNTSENVYFTIDDIVFKGCGIEDLIRK
ncbi:MAG: beta-sandwich domain-containing protein [Chitinispirillaceae bacterium]